MSCLLMVENFYSAGAGLQFPLHTIAGDEEAAGFEAFHVADGRRSALDYWTTVTANAQHTLTATCDRVRAANCCFLDRGHNLASFQVFVEASQDNVNWQTVVSPVIPTASMTGPITNVNGIATEEGAWGLLFPSPASGTYWRLRIPALGSGVNPKVVGFWLGLAYTPLNNFLMPWSEDQDQLFVQETVSEWGWRGRGPTAVPNGGTITTRLLTDDEYDLARYSVGGHYSRGRPMWICYDQAQADRMFLAIRPTGGMGYGYEGGWYPRQSRLPYIEHEPLRLS